MSDHLCYVPSKVFKRLAEIYPEGVSPRSGDFVCDLIVDDPRLEKLLQCLGEFGFTPGSFKFQKPKGQFSYRIDREYEKDDYESCEYLVLWAKDYLADTIRNANGNIELKTMPKKIANIAACEYGDVISDRLLSKLCEWDFRYLAYYDVQIATKCTPQTTTKFYELFSELRLPPLHPKCTLFTNNGEPFEPRMKVGCFLVEGHYNPAELHYLESSIRPLEPFDFAYTHEGFGGFQMPFIVVSKRVYDFFQANKLDVTFVPVRIDPD